MVLDQIGIGDALTIITVCGAAIGFLLSMHKDRQGRLREYASNIRQAAALVVAKSERLARSYTHLFDSVQKHFVDADMAVVGDDDIPKIRDDLWRSLVSEFAELKERIHAEQIEISYSELFGYDTKVRELYVRTINQINRQGEEAFHRLLLDTQATVLGVENDGGIRNSSSVTGNELRATASAIEQELIRGLNESLGAFRDQITKIQDASDRVIFTRSVNLSIPKLLDSECGEIVSTQAMRLAIRPNEKNITRRASNQLDNSCRVFFSEATNGSNSGLSISPNADSNNQDALNGLVPCQPEGHFRTAQDYKKKTRLE